MMKQINKLLKSSKVVVFLDFEGTQFSQEIIAIGAIKVTLDNKNHIKKVSPGFKKYVKAFGEIGKFVKELTGISEETLDKEGVNFLYAMKYFQKYCGNEKNIKFITYGNFDMRLLHQSSEINNMQTNLFIKNIFNNYIDFTSIFNQFIKSDKGTQLSLIDALKIFKIKPKGEPHDPLFDAENLMLLYEAFITKKAIVLEEYRNVILNHKQYPNPVAKILKDLKNKKTVSYSDLTKYIEEDI